MNILERIKNVFVPQKPEQRNIALNSLWPGNDNFINDKALTLTAVWCACRLLSESVSALPIDVFTKQKNGDKIQVQNGDYLIWN